MVNGIFAPLNLETVLNQGQEEHCTGLIPVKKDTITPYIFQHQSSTHGFIICCKEKCNLH